MRASIEAVSRMRFGGFESFEAAENKRLTRSGFAVEYAALIEQRLNAL
jgi:hypothetical protein|tara:strand:- start:307 stop:450 length:144 start_codon:yes stop_codon:yes gene_type:complete